MTTSVAKRCVRVSWGVVLLAAWFGASRMESAERGGEPMSELASMLAGTDDTQFQLDLLRGIQAAAKGRRSLPMPSGWEGVEAKLAKSSDPEVRTIAQRLSLTFGSRRALAELRAAAGDKTGEPAVRLGAVDSLLSARDPELPGLLQGLIREPAMRVVALRGLAAYEHVGTPGAILALYPEFSPSERREALNTLASRLTFAQPLVGAISRKTVPKSDLTADLVRQLRGLKHPAISAQLTEIWGLMSETSPDMQKEIEKYLKVYRAGGSTPGDAPRGRVVFNRVCGQCHHLFDSGGNVGPDITGANRGDVNYLLENILFPNAVIPNEYRSSLVEMKDSRVLTGLVKAQDANSVTLQTATEVLTLPRAEVASITTGEQSMMPEGLMANLSETEIRDLLYYLGRPGQVPLPAGAP